MRAKSVGSIAQSSGILVSIIERKAKRTEVPQKPLTGTSVLTTST